MSYYSMDKTMGHCGGGRTQISYLYPLLVPVNHFLPENALQPQMWKKITRGQSMAERLRLGGTYGGHLAQPPAQRRVSHKIRLCNSGFYPVGS